MRLETKLSAREIFSIMREVDGDAFIASLALKSFSRDPVEQIYHAKIVARWMNEGGVMFRNRHRHVCIVNPHNEVGARLIRMRRRKIQSN